MLNYIPDQFICLRTEVIKYGTLSRLTHRNFLHYHQNYFSVPIAYISFLSSFWLLSLFLFFTFYFLSSFDCPVLLSPFFFIDFVLFFIFLLVYMGTGVPIYEWAEDRFHRSCASEDAPDPRSTCSTPRRGRRRCRPRCPGMGHGPGGRFSTERSKLWCRRDTAARSPTTVVPVPSLGHDLVKKMNC